MSRQYKWFEDPDVLAAIDGVRLSVKTSIRIATTQGWHNAALYVMEKGDERRIWQERAPENESIREFAAIMWVEASLHGIGQQEMAAGLLNDGFYAGTPVEESLKRIAGVPLETNRFAGRPLVKAHTHKAIKGKERDRCWTHCVAPDTCAASPQRQAAHGNITRHDTCACGATRQTELNAGRANYGAWREGR